MKNARPMLSTLVLLLGLSVNGPTARAQMMGSQMGPMMGSSGEMRSMHDVMAWMNGAEIKARPAKPEPVLDASMRSLGERLYSLRCAVCHGAEGDGKGPRATELLPSPRDFSRGVYKFRSTPSGALPTDEDLWEVVSDGLHGTAMVPWVSLSENERWALVARVKGFSSRFSSEVHMTPIVVPNPPPENRELAQQGMKLYREDCATCHGPKGRGDGPTVTDTPKLRNQVLDFTSGFFKRGSNLEDIYLTLRTGLDGTPMPSFAQALTPDQTWAIAAYIRTLIVRPRQPAEAMQPMTTDSRGYEQQRLGMMIDMPGMAGMHLGMDGSTR